MTAPRTRIELGATAFERDLLRSWEQEQPSEASRQAALALAGSVAPAGLGTAAALKAAGGSMAPVGAAAVGKWAFVSVGTGVLALATAGVAVHAARSARTSSPTKVAIASSIAVPTMTAVPAFVPRAVIAPAAPATTTIAQEAPSAAHPAVAVAPKAPRVAPSVAPTPEPPSGLELGQEVATLDRARSALASGDAAGAIRDIDAYDREFPGGVLAQEATTVRIEALMQQGNRDAAVSLADRFLQANPKSPHAERIRLLVQRAY